MPSGPQRPALGAVVVALSLITAAGCAATDSSPASPTVSVPETARPPWVTVDPPPPFTLPVDLDARASLEGSDCIGCDYELRFRPDGTVEMRSLKVGAVEGTYAPGELDARLSGVRAMIAEDASYECDGSASHQQTLSVAIPEGSLRACADELVERLAPFVDFVTSTRAEIERAWAAELAVVEPIVIVTGLPPGCADAGCATVTRLFVDGRWEDSSAGSGVFDPSAMLDANDRFGTERGYEHIWFPDEDIWGQPCTVEERPALAEFRYEIGVVENVTDRSAVVRCEDDLYRFQPTIAAIDDALREIAGRPPSPIDSRAISKGIDGGPDLVSYASPLRCPDCQWLTLTENGAAVLDGNYPELGGTRIDYDVDMLRRLLDETVIEELAIGRRDCADDRSGVASLATRRFRIDFCWVEPDMTHPLLSWLEEELERVVALVG